MKKHGDQRSFEMKTSIFSLQNMHVGRTLGVNVGAIMKRRLVWFESLQDMGQSEAESWEAGTSGQRSLGVEKLRSEDLSRLKRAIIADPAMRVAPAPARPRTQREK